MADSTTANYGWAYPTVNADANTWGSTLNAAIIAIDAQMYALATATLRQTNNLSDLSSIATARSHLGLGSAALANASDNAGTVAGITGTLVVHNIPIWNTANGTLQDSGYAPSSFDAAGSASAAQTNAQSYAAGVASAAQSNAQSYADSNKLAKSSNLSDLGSASSARGNLGLGSIATHNITISTASPSGGSDGDIWFQYS